VLADFQTAVEGLFLHGQTISIEDQTLRVHFRTPRRAAIWIKAGVRQDSAFNVVNHSDTRGVWHPRCCCKAIRAPTLRVTRAKLINAAQARYVSGVAASIENTIFVQTAVNELHGACLRQADSIRVKQYMNAARFEIRHNVEDLFIEQRFANAMENNTFELWYCSTIRCTSAG